MDPRLARSLVGVDSSPLEVALVLGDGEFVQLIFSQISYEQYLHGIELLCSKYPYSRDSIIRLFFAVDESEWQKIHQLSLQESFDWIKKNAKPLTLPNGEVYKEQKETLQKLQTGLIKQILKPTGDLMCVKQALQDAAHQYGLDSDKAAAPLATLKATKLQVQTAGI